MKTPKLISKIRATPGIWIALLALALVGGRLLWVSAGRPAHRREITDAYGTARLFLGDPYLSHDGLKFTYQATSDHGVSLYVCEVATGHRQTVCEEHGSGDFGSSTDLHAWPWAPDDSAFAYSLQDQLIIHSTEPAKDSPGLTSGANAVTDLVWVNPGEFAYVTWKTNLCYARREADGTWQPHDLLQGGGFASLTAVDTNTIAWVQDGLICRLDLSLGVSGTSKLLAARPTVTAATPVAEDHPPTNGLVLWLDAATLAQPDQSPVTGLADLSPARNDAVPNGHPPTYNGPASPGALNGKGTVHFTSAGAATGLKTRANLDLAGNTPRTILAVLRQVNNGVMRINIGDFNKRWGGYYLEEEKTSLYLPRFWRNWANRVILRSPDWNLAGMVADGTNEWAYVNGDLMGTKSNVLATVAAPVEIGLRTGGTNSVGADGDLAELLIYNVQLGDGDRQQAERYLKSKWLTRKRVAGNSPLVWFDPQLPGLTGFSYSPATGRFLLQTTSNGRNLLWRYDPAGGTNDPVQVAAAPHMISPQWVGDTGCAYAVVNAGTNAVLLGDGRDAPRTVVTGAGDLRWFQATPDGGKLLIMGTFHREASEGVWRYDLGAGQLQPLVPGSDHPSVYARFVEPSQSTIKLASGKSIRCTIFPPAGLNPHKKYPLVLGYTVVRTILNNGADGRLWVADLATCGAYVVVVDRPTWFGDIELYGEYVQGAYEVMAKNPRVDTSRVYLFGASAETQYMTQIATDPANRWRGIIYLNPTGLPDFSGLPHFGPKPKILISAGGEEHEEARLAQYQAEALQAGVLVEYVIHPGEGHHLLGNAAQNERTQAMMHFIFEE